MDDGVGALRVSRGGLAGACPVGGLDPAVQLVVLRVIGASEVNGDVCRYPDVQRAPSRDGRGRSHREHGGQIHQLDLPGLPHTVAVSVAHLECDLVRPVRQAGNLAGSVCEQVGAIQIRVKRTTGGDQVAVDAAGPGVTQLVIIEVP